MRYLAEQAFEFFLPLSGSDAVGYLSPCSLRRSYALPGLGPEKLSMRHFVPLCLLVASLAVLASCGGGGTSSETTLVVHPAMSSYPSNAFVGLGGTEVILVSFVGTNNTSITCSIQEGSLGGSADCSQPAQATFTAPATAGTYHLIITSQADPTVSLTVTLRVTSGAGKFVPTTGLPVTGRFKCHTATLLPNGMVLIAGGGSVLSGGAILASAEVYNPTTGMFVATGTMNNPRYDHTAILLPNGEVLVAGGSDASGNPLSSAELYDPGTGTFTSLSSMATPRARHTATLLGNGKVLLAGGNAGTGSSFTVFNTAELFDPGTSIFTTTGNLTAARGEHTATVLQDGRVLLTGGYDNNPANGQVSAEIYDPASGQFTATGSMATPRAFHTTTLLQNGKVLVTGALNLLITGGEKAELFDPTNGTFSPTGNMNVVRFFPAATPLANGQVLITGGLSAGGGIFVNSDRSAELYDPASGLFYVTANMNRIRFGHRAILLPDGTVLVVGDEIESGKPTGFNDEADLYLP